MFFNASVFINKSKIHFESMMVRVNFGNEDHRHKIGSLVNAKIRADSLETLWVPVTAIVDLGKNKIVWVWKGDAFKAVKVETGIRVNDLIEIADGLSEIFSKQNKKTIENYFILYRIEKAKVMISDSAHSFSEIAFKLGYNSLSYLSKQFKATEGVSMSDYKRKPKNRRKRFDKI